LILEGELAYKSKGFFFFSKIHFSSLFLLFVFPLTANPAPNLPYEGSGKPQSPPGRATNPTFNNNFMPAPLKIPAAALNTNEKANKVIKKGFLSYFRRKQYD